MRILVLVGAGIDISETDIKPYTPYEVKKNSYPEEGLAIFNLDKIQPDWSWADYTIRVGEVYIGRNHADLTIAGHRDPIGAIVEWLEALDEGDVVEE